MLTPTKGITPQRALLTIAAQISITLMEPMTVSQLWLEFQKWRDGNGIENRVSFGWFVLALDVLFAIGVIEFEDNLLYKITGK